MGIISQTVTLLEKHSFVPAQAEAEEMTGGWTLRDLLISAAGADRLATPVAYWEGRELRAALNESWVLLEAVIGSDSRAWSNESDRSAIDVRRALEATVGDVEPPGTLRLRPGSTTERISTCRIPFVPTVAAVQAWMLLGDGVTVTSFMDHHGIGVGLSSWDLLDLLDPHISTAPIPEPLVETATSMREHMAKQKPPVQVTAKFLHLVADRSPDATVDIASRWSLQVPGNVEWPV